MPVLAAALWLTSCQTHAGPATKSASPPPTAEAAAEYNALLQKGDYAGAIAFVGKSTLAANEKDGISGTLILDGLADPSPSTRPPFPLAEGFNRMEKAAAAGRVQSVADLRGKFTTGINSAGKNVLMPPNRELAECWGNVEAGKGKAAACITMRRRLRVP